MLAQMWLVWVTASAALAAAAAGTTVDTVELATSNSPSNSNSTSKSNSTSSSNTTVTGQQVCNPTICVTALRDAASKIDTYTLAPAADLSIGLSEFGWIAIGFGSQMANSPMIITWPNSDGTFTLSQRQATGEVAPKVVSSPARKATLQSAKSFSNTSSTAITFTLPVTSSSTSSSSASAASASSSTSSSTSLIWAYSSRNPNSSSSSATIQQHDNMGTMSVDLLAAYSPSGSSSSSSDADTEGPSRSIIVTHAVIGGVATLAVFPLGVLIPRIARGFTTKRWWFPAHSAANGLVGGVLVIVAFGLAVNRFDGGINSAHRKCGLALFILVIAQVALGIGMHYYRPPRTILFTTAAGRGPSNFSHMLLGLVVLVLGWVTAWYGIDREWAVYSGSALGVGWKVLWGLVVSITSLVYIAGLVFLLPKQRDMEAGARRTRRETDLELSRAAYLKEQGGGAPAPAPAHATHATHATHAQGYNAQPLPRTAAYPSQYPAQQPTAQWQSQRRPVPPLDLRDQWT